MENVPQINVIHTHIHIHDVQMNGWMNEVNGKRMSKRTRKRISTPNPLLYFNENTSYFINHSWNIHLRQVSTHVFVYHFVAADFATFATFNGLWNCVSTYYYVYTTYYNIIYVWHMGDVTTYMWDKFPTTFVSKTLCSKFTICRYMRKVDDVYAVNRSFSD